MIRQLSFACLSFFFLSGFGKPRSSVATEAKKEGQTLSMKFLIKPISGIAVNPEGPWLLTLSNPEGIKLDMKDGKFESKTLDEKLPGFAVSAETLADAKAAKVDYVMRAFVCTEDKKHCYQDTHKGSLSWNEKT